MSTEINPGAEKAKKAAPTRAANSVRISGDAFQKLTKHAKKLGVSNGEYASAAIAYFADSGFDPREEHLLDGPLTRSKISEGVANVRAHNADIGNRLFALTRGFEKTMYLFMQQQEHNMNVYLEGIEGNLMRRLVSMEDNLLLPLVEHVMRGAGDAYIGRSLGERIYLEILKKPSSLWEEQNDKLTDEREQVLVQELKKFMTDHMIPPAVSTRRPATTPVPPKPAAPVAAPTQAPAATPPKP
ncbi:MAG TPA: hypothetical protein VFO93_19095 [Hymenobacter sp.]|uniref:hypothetical protein n=1 Tax=Hymenobacter sp. TaxID=1898978 RepID=UPI002D7F0867|nr:hypothetical protein [Hymenobacter sp.]HET9505659.1 hypothetical protein [Hymenobacter sp.]